MTYHSVPKPSRRDWGPGGGTGAFYTCSRLRIISMAYCQGVFLHMQLGVFSEGLFQVCSNVLDLPFLAFFARIKMKCRKTKSMRLSLLSRTNQRTSIAEQASPASSRLSPLPSEPSTSHQLPKCPPSPCFPGQPDPLSNGQPLLLAGNCPLNAPPPPSIQLPPAPNPRSHVKKEGCW